MPNGRTNSDRGRTSRGTPSPAARRSERVRGGTTAAKSQGTKRPGGRRPVRSRSGSGTGGAFKLSSTRRASVLALLVCTMALSVSVPLRTYLTQQDELAGQHGKQAELTRQVQVLENRKSELSDPARVEAEARARLGYVRPGETPYMVQVPGGQPDPAVPPKQPSDGAPWYEQLWKSMTGKES